MKNVTRSISRRHFLRTAVCGLGVCAAHRIAPRLVAATSSPSAGAGASEPRVLVIVQLEGGNDGFNTVVPFHDDRYHRLRPTLSLKRQDLVFLNETLALHQACSSLEPLFKEGKLAIVDGVGCSQPSLSHFRAAEIWQTASASDDVSYSGWAGRCCSSLSSAEPSLSAYFSTASIPRLLVREEDRAPADSKNFPRTRLACSGADPVASLREVGERAGCTGKNEIYFISVPGFDTHFRQAEVHASRLQAVSLALAALQLRLEQRGIDRRVTTMVFSEFGRSTAENFQGGTDHGGAGPVFLLGTSVRGGLHPGAFSRGNSFASDVPAFDFRRIVKTVTTRWLNLPVSSVFERDPGHADFLIS